MVSMKHVFSEEIFEPKFELEGPHLVAASAGTGKTYNIQNIYVRLVAEKGFRVSQIQVMTFTEAATKELRDRVRAVLSNMARFLAGETDGIKQDELENSKMVFFFHMALLFVITVALIIIVLSVAFIIMSLNVIVQKNRDLFVNLYGIGYSPRQIARYYQRIVGLITVADIAVAVGLSLFLRHLYVNRLASLFSIEGSIVPLVATAVLLTPLLVVAYSLIILRTIRKTVEPSAPRRLP